MTWETICALATPFGRSAIAVIRVSGPSTTTLLSEISERQSFEPRVATLTRLIDREGRPIDEVLITFFAGPASYTGEDMAEVACHGNPSIVERILEEIVSRETRLAEPGEFTRRALANGKMTLDQVESLDQLIHASSFEGARTALESKLRGLGPGAARLQEELMDLMVEIQSQLDFSEDEVGTFDRSHLLQQIDHLHSALKSWLKDYQKKQHLFKRRLIVLVGPPNSGKSSLFNALIGESKAIVFDQPGTTRDFVEQSVVWRGRELHLVDTAGVREDAEAIEALGIQKTIELLRQAEVAVWVAERDLLPPPRLQSVNLEARWILLQSKVDLHGAISNKLAVSSVTGQGLEELRSALVGQVDSGEASAELPTLTSKRQAALVEAAVEHLEEARAHLERGGFLDQAAHRVLKAEGALREMAGGAPTEEVLKTIFARFCIGK